MIGIAAALVALILWSGTAVTPRVGPRVKRRWGRPAKKKEPDSKREEPEDLGMVVAEVATRLRAGERTELAWKRTLERAGFAGQDELDESGVPQAMRTLWNQRSLPWKKAGHLRTGIPAAVAVCRMSRLTGAPTADIFDSCARGITEAGEAAAARTIALAGPKASAKMLAWLPLMGIGFGTIIGARPLVFLATEPIGHVCLLIGGGLEVAGILWIRRLMVSAGRAA